MARPATGIEEPGMEPVTSKRPAAPVSNPEEAAAGVLRARFLVRIPKVRGMDRFRTLP